jgi:hypothetical protein
MCLWEVSVVKRIGTISAASGFIFLGFWMIVSQRNPSMGDMLFKWWPLIIILLGVELLLSFSHREEGSRLRLNGIVIPVILIFLLVNVFKDVRVHVGEGFRWLNNSRNFNEVVDILKNIDDDNYKVIDSNKVLEVYGIQFILDTNNGDVNINKSEDGKIKLEAKIYVNKNSSQFEYEIREKKEGDGYRVKIDESYVKKVRLNLYIPEGVVLRFEGNNLRLVSDYQIPGTSFEADVNNGSIDISYAESINLRINNGKVDIKNAKNAVVKSNNAVVNIESVTEIIDLNVNNGVVSVDNKICRNINVKMNSGTVKVKTADNNADVKLKIDRGPCVLNGERRINSGISRVFGSGDNKIKVDVNNGMITFIN